MDWNVNATGSWELTELEQQTVHATNAFGRATRLSSDFSVDLKLGRVGNSSHIEVTNNWQQAGVSNMEALPSVSAKRARATSNVTQTAVCLVDGCNSDLRSGREYHRRHKVCELHSKSPQVTIGGHMQRFCQQCSRFHSLEEFDEGKRSCRKRLDGHNRRRRKPQRDPPSHPASFCSIYRGPQPLEFTGSNVYPSMTLVNPAYDLNHRITSTGQQKRFLESSPSSYNEEKQIPFPEMGGAGMFGYRQATMTIVPTQVHDPDCALSLLSLANNSSWNHIAHPATQSHGDHNHLQHLVSSVRDADALGPVIFQGQSDVPYGNKSQQATHPLNWDLV